MFNVILSILTLAELKPMTTLILHQLFQLYSNLPYSRNLSCVLILQISNDSQKLKLAHDIVSVCSLVIAHVAFSIFCYVKAYFNIIISSQ